MFAIKKLWGWELKEGRDSKPGGRPYANGMEVMPVMLQFPPRGDFLRTTSAEMPFVLESPMFVERNIRLNTLCA